MLLQYEKSNLRNKIVLYGGCNVFARYSNNSVDEQYILNDKIIL